MEKKEASGRLRALDLRRDFEGLSKLIETAFAEDFQRITERGASLAQCTHRQRARPYQLYLSLGFVHFDSTTHLRLDGVPNVELKQIKGYALRPMGLGEWRARYELAKQATPPEVQAFNPLSEREYRVALWLHLLGPFFNFLQKVEDHRWATEANGRVIGVMTLQVCYP